MAIDPVHSTLKEQRDAALDLAADESDDRHAAEEERRFAEQVAVTAALDRDIAVSQRNRVAAERNLAEQQRDSAQTAAALAQNEAQSNATGVYVLVGVILFALVIFAFVYLTRGTTSPTSVTVTHSQPPLMAQPANPPPQVLVQSAPAAMPASPATPAAPAVPAPPATPAAPVNSDQPPVVNVVPQPASTGDTGTAQSNGTPSSSGNNGTSDNSTPNAANQ